MINVVLTVHTGQCSAKDMFFLKMGLFFVYVRSFQTIFYRVSVIQTRIDGVEGEHADLLTITTAQDMFF